MIANVRRLLNAKTDTEAIQRALRKAIEDREIEESLDALLREGRFRKIYRQGPQVLATSCTDGAVSASFTARWIRSIVKGLVSTGRPASVRNAWVSALMVSPVMKTTRAARAGRSTSNRRQIALPSRSGRRTSSSTTSYSWLANRATASWPLGVSST